MFLFKVLINNWFINMSINSFFILASTSKSRISILKKNKLNFTTKKPCCDEAFYKKKFKKLKYSSKKVSLELSKCKARSISKENKNKLIIGSDTVIEYKGKLIKKAKTLGEAQKKIKKLSGKTHTIISSATAYYNQKMIWSKSEKTMVKIRKLTAKDISKYIKKCGNPILESVGCYQIEKSGPNIIETIKGDFFNVMGFPLFSFLEFLQKTNLKKIYEKQQSSSNRKQR